jgi:2-dehydropantoate 2-reductase
MRIAVMGTGGTGGYFGSLLAKAGEDVAFIARGFHLEVIRSRGLTVKSQIAGDFTLRVKATHNPQEIRGPVDVVLFCVKTYDTIAAAELIHPIVGPKTVVLSVQTGIDNEERITQIVGEQAVIGAVAQVTALVEAPGVVAQSAGPGRILLGELTGGNSSRTEKLQRIFQRAGIATELHPDIRIALWDKFVFICAFSGITAFTRLPLGHFAPIRRPVSCCVKSWLRLNRWRGRRALPCRQIVLSAILPGLIPTENLMPMDPCTLTWRPIDAWS